MQLLEADLGVQLFQRVARGMRLTEEGDFLREALPHPIEQIDTALRDVQSLSTRAEASCVLGLPPVLMKLLGPRLYRRLATEMPNLRLTLVEYDSAQLAVGLLRGHIDIAILTGLVPDDRLYHTEILSEPLLVVGSPDSPLRHKKDVRFSELVEYPLILPPKPAVLGNTLEKLAARVSSKIHVAYEISAFEVAKDLIQTGAGYGILTPMAFRAEREAGTLIGRPVIEPSLMQQVHTVSQAHWRIARSTYRQFHELFYSELIDIVESGDWEATWVANPQEILSSG